MTSDHPDHIRAGLDMLRAGYTVAWQPSVRRDDGACTMPYPLYDEKLMAALAEASDRVGVDSAYTDHTDRMDAGRIESASTQTLSTWFTSLRRGERFCDGHIAAYVDNGILERLFARVLELPDPSGR